MMDNIAFSVQLTCDYQKAYQIVTNALKEEGFGVITEIDVKATIKEKLGKDFRKYAILGACNPPLAHKALEGDPLVGLMLPCNVTIEENETGTLVNLVNPEAMLLSNPRFSENQALQEVAQDVTERFTRIANTLET
jgi:uncharacterized protein (DUF302 family)